MSSDDIYLALDGPSALSQFRARSLLGRIQTIEPSVTEMHAQHVHFVHARRELDDHERTRLTALLDYGEPGHPARFQADAAVAGGAAAGNDFCSVDRKKSL